MTASPIQATPRISLSEWLRLRRHPMPEFYDHLRALPPSLLPAALTALPPGRAVRGALVLPPEYYVRKKVHWEYVPERALIFLDGAALHVTAAMDAAAPQVMLIDAWALLYLRSSLLLLYGLLEFEADCGGSVGEVRIEYNTIIWQALRGPLGRFVSEAGPCTSSVEEAEALERNAAIIRKLPFKFANGLRYYALEPGELLHAAVFQPAIWQRRAILPQQITPNTLFALTDRKVALIEESRTSAWRQKRADGEYGWIFTYIPRDRVADMTVTSGPIWTEMTLRLEWGSARHERTFLVEPAIAEKWQQAWI